MVTGSEVDGYPVNSGITSERIWIFSVNILSHEVLYGCVLESAVGLGCRVCLGIRCQLCGCHIRL